MGEETKRYWVTTQILARIFVYYGKEIFKKYCNNNVKKITLDNWVFALWKVNKTYRSIPKKTKTKINGRDRRDEPDTITSVVGK